MIKGLIQDKDITLIIIYAPNTGAHKHVMQILTDIKEESDKNTVIVGYFNTSITSMSRSSKWKINKEAVVLNNKINKTLPAHQEVKRKDPNKVRNDRGELTTNNADIQKVITGYYKVICQQISQFRKWTHF